MDEFKKHFPNIEDNFVTDFNEYLKLIPNSSQFDRNDIALIYKALYKADYLHKNSKPRKTGEPYITHPIAVSSILVKYGLDAETCAAALLHDTVEDTNTALEDIEKQFGLRVRQLVAKESEDKKESMPKSQSWQIRKQEAIDKLKQEDDLGVKIVCLCYKVSNLRSFQLLCFDKGDDAWNSFNMKDPKKHYWYYSSILEALSELKDTPVYKEYDFLVHSIFDKYIREGL